MRTFIVIFLCALSTYAFAQQDEPEVFIIIDNLPIHKECAKIKSKQEKHECTQIKLKEFISKNTNYPEVPDSINFNGYIEVYFVIGEDGEILQDRTKALGNFSGEFADLFTAEALRVINSIPNLIPANKGEKFHRVQYTLPVIFKK